MSKKSKSSKQTLIAMIIFCALLIGAYYFISKDQNKTENSEEIEIETEYETLVNKDLETTYPATPREVVKLYCRYSKCLYNEALQDEEIEELSQKIRNLYDEELNQNNSEENYLYNLKMEIADFRNNNRTITKIQIAKAEDVQTWTDSEQEYAKMNVAITQKELEVTGKSVEEFLLRKDASGRWKILGFRKDSDSNS